MREWTRCFKAGEGLFTDLGLDLTSILILDGSTEAASVRHFGW